MARQSQIVWPVAAVLALTVGCRHYDCVDPRMLVEELGTDTPEGHAASRVMAAFEGDRVCFTGLYEVWWFPRDAAAGYDEETRELWWQSSATTADFARAVCEAVDDQSGVSRTRAWHSAGWEDVGSSPARAMLETCSLWLDEKHPAQRSSPCMEDNNLSDGEAAGLLLDTLGPHPAWQGDVETWTAPRARVWEAARGRVVSVAADDLGVLVVTEDDTDGNYQAWRLGPGGAVTLAGPVDIQVANNGPPPELVSSALGTVANVEGGLRLVDWDSRTVIPLKYPVPPDNQWATGPFVVGQSVLWVHVGIFGGDGLDAFATAYDLETEEERRLSEFPPWDRSALLVEQGPGYLAVEDSLNNWTWAPADGWVERGPAAMRWGRNETQQLAVAEPGVVVGRGFLADLGSGGGVSSPCELATGAVGSANADYVFEVIDGQLARRARPLR